MPSVPLFLPPCMSRKARIAIGWSNSFGVVAYTLFIVFIAEFWEAGFNNLLVSSTSFGRRCQDRFLLEMSRLSIVELERMSRKCIKLYSCHNKAVVMLI